MINNCAISLLPFAVDSMLTSNKLLLSYWLEWIKRVLLTRKVLLSKELLCKSLLMISTHDIANEKLLNVRAQYLRILSIRWIVDVINGFIHFKCQVKDKSRLQNDFAFEISFLQWEGLWKSMIWHESKIMKSSTKIKLVPHGVGKRFRSHSLTRVHKLRTDKTGKFLSLLSYRQANKHVLHHRAYI